MSDIQDAADEIVRLRQVNAELRDSRDKAAIEHAAAYTALRDENARLMKENANLFKIASDHAEVQQETVDSFCEDMEKLRDENAALRADAERYSWLRRHENWTGLVFPHYGPAGEESLDGLQGDELDAAIDTARGKE